MAVTINKHIRIDEELWERLEKAAGELDTTANRLLTKLAAQWLEKRAWPRTEAEIQVARASLFTAQAIANDMITAGRGREIDEIRRYIATIVPDTGHPSAAQPDAPNREGKEDAPS